MMGPTHARRWVDSLYLAPFADASFQHMLLQMICLIKLQSIRIYIDLIIIIFPSYVVKHILLISFHSWVVGRFVWDGNKIGQSIKSGYHFAMEIFHYESKASISYSKYNYEFWLKNVEFKSA